MRTDFEGLYHDVEDRHWWFIGRRDLLVRLVRESSPDPASRILDIGCSGGATIRRLRECGYRNVTGIDISPQAIARCRQQGLDNVHEMDAQAPDFPAAGFDVILASDVLEHVDDEQAALSAWFALLRPGGLLIALVPAFMALWGPHDEANEHRRRYRLPELRQAVARGGFVTQRAAYWNFLLFPPAAVLRLAQRVLPARERPSLELRLPVQPLNLLLQSVLLAENRFLRGGLDWPWGLSALVTARKPAGAVAQAGSS